MPKMISFGDEEDSVVNELTEAGYEVKPINAGLGEYEVIQDIFRQHLQDCIDDLYGKRSHIALQSQILNSAFVYLA